MRKQSNTEQKKTAGKPKEKRFTLFMQKKLAVLFFLILYHIYQYSLTKN